MSCTLVVNCGPPSPPSNCDGHIMEPITNSLEGAEVIFLCRSTFQFGQQSLCMEVNITTICNKEGIWEAIADDIDTCAGLRGLSGIVSFSTVIYLWQNVMAFTIILRHIVGL